MIRGNGTREVGQVLSRPFFLVGKILGNDPSKNSIREALSNDFQSILAGELGTGKKEVAGWSVAKIASGPVSTECECYIFTRRGKFLHFGEVIWSYILEPCLCFYSVTFGFK